MRLGAWVILGVSGLCILISEESGGMTGQCSVVDGGWL